MQISVEEISLEQLNNCLPKEIPNPFVVYLNTKENEIKHEIYTSYLTKLFEILISIDQSYRTNQIILIPLKKLNPSYEHVAIGGTFDRLHCGHYSLFQSGLFSSTKLFSIGVTGDVLLSKKKCRELIKPFIERQDQVDAFFKTIAKFTHIPSYKLFEINVPEGTAGTDEDMNALVVSKETVGSMNYINGLRKQNGLNPVESIVIELIQSTNGSKVSSSDLRKEEQTQN